MADVWRECNSDEFQFTWHRKAPTLAMARLDYILVTSKISGWTGLVCIKPGYKSSHSLISLRV